MFDDIINPKKEKKKKREVIFRTCIGCDRILKEGERCKICDPEYEKEYEEGVIPV